jgi:hypothetical protein
VPERLARARTREVTVIDPTEQADVIQAVRDATFRAAPMR